MDDGKNSTGAWPRESDVGKWTDAYFNRTRTTVQAFGDVEVTYAVFMRRPVVCAPRLMIEWLEAMAAARSASCARARPIRSWKTTVCRPS